MSAVALDRAPAASTTATPAPIPFGRLAAVELRKMFDTRSGFWLMTSIGSLALLATGAVIVVAPDGSITYGAFTQAIGFPLAVILPIVAILAVTSEWSQRSGLTTFTLVPHRGRVVAAKAACTVGVGVTSMLLAFGIGALGNLLGAAVNGLGPVWDASLETYSMIMLADVIGMLVGFTLGVLLRSSAAAIVGYFVYSLLLPTVLGMLAAYQEWFRDLRPWVDFNDDSTLLYDGGFTATDWLHLAVSGLLWLVLPLLLGLRLLLRSEVK